MDNPQSDLILTEAEEPILETRRLSVALAGKQVLHEVSLRIHRGESTSIIGPNGAGKTTLLKALAGLIDVPPDSVFIRGSPLESFSRREMARTLGYVPQMAERSASCTVLDFVSLSRYAHRSSWFGALSKADIEAVRRALEETRATPFMDRDISTLSGGERQKVMIAAALAQESPILLLDEPSSFLDYRQASEIGVLLSRLNREAGLTVISVVHDLNQGALEGNRLIALNRGKIVFQGIPAELANSRRLEEIYGISFDILQHEKTNRCLLIPLPPNP